MERVGGFLEDVRCVLASEGHMGLERGKQVVSDVRDQCVRGGRVPELCRGQRVNAGEQWKQKFER